MPSCGPGPSPTRTFRPSLLPAPPSCGIPTAAGRVGSTRGVSWRPLGGPPAGGSVHSWGRPACCQGLRPGRARGPAVVAVRPGRVPSRGPRTALGRRADPPAGRRGPSRRGPSYGAAAGPAGRPGPLRQAVPRAVRGSSSPAGRSDRTMTAPQAVPCLGWAVCGSSCGGALPAAAPRRAVPGGSADRPARLCRGPRAGRRGLGSRPPRGAPQPVADRRAGRLDLCGGPPRAVTRAVAGRAADRRGPSRRLPRRPSHGPPPAKIKKDDAPQRTVGAGWEDAPVQRGRSRYARAGEKGPRTRCRSG